MSRTISISIVGAGSSYTPEIVDGILTHSVEELPIRQLSLMDIRPDRLAVMAGLSQRMIHHAGRPIAVRSGTRLEEMVDGADFVITQIRVGGMEARHLDETIPLKYGIIGQETTGPGGMFKALRTIPPMIEIARTVERVSPKAFVLNYTNPSGIITEAVRKHTDARLIGLCSGIPGMQQMLRRRLGEVYPDLATYCVGLNHLGFIHRILSGGRDVTVEAIERMCAEDEAVSGDNAADMTGMRLAKLLGAVPIGYARYYFNRAQMLEKARSAPETRAQQVLKLERETFEEAARPETVRKPQALLKRGGRGYAGITFMALGALLSETGAEVPANVLNRGAVEGIEDDASVEVVCRMDRNGATPLPVGPIPLAFRGVVQAVKAYETLTVEAAVKRDRRLAVRALLNHPLVGDLDVVEPLVDEMLAAHRLKFS